MLTFNPVLSRCGEVCCPSCGVNDISQTTQAPAIIVSFMGMIGIDLPIWCCNRCVLCHFILFPTWVAVEWGLTNICSEQSVDAGFCTVVATLHALMACLCQFVANTCIDVLAVRTPLRLHHGHLKDAYNLCCSGACRCPHRVWFNQPPSMAACYPGTPVDAVRLQVHDRAVSAPPLWFRGDLLSQLYFMRLHCRGTSHYAMSGALQRHFAAVGLWDRRVTSARFQTSLGNALDSFAALQVNCANPQLLGLPPAGLADCCDVCSQGHMGFLQQQQAAHLLNGVPARGPGAVSSAGPLEHDQQPQQQQPAAEGLGSVRSAPQDSDRSAGAQQQAQLVTNPLPGFTPYKKPVAVLYTYTDGLQRVPHLAKAGW